MNGRRYAKENGAGVAVSLALHALLLCLVLLQLVQHSAVKSFRPEPFVAVDLVRLGEETRSPPAALHALVPQQKAGRHQDEASPVRAAVSPTGKKPPPEDALDAKLRALARLKQPNTKVTLDPGQGVAAADFSNGLEGDAATYSIRDYVLAQVLRRWTVDLAKVKDRPLVIALRVTMKRDGSIALSEIVEQGRAKTDAYYRDIAIGARNAVLLSSPIGLPPGDYPKEMHFVLKLDTRAILR
ncbi:MAG: hypothetical protein P4L57_13310 [Rhizomicrobium sp.]|nr:hypothetical protein [Rhizomicrobium sp.]